MKLLWIIGGLVGLFVIALTFASRRTVALRRSGLMPAAGQATMADVERLAQAGEKIAAIRCYREIHNVGLAEAKKAVEDLAPGR
jgi:ribosomal protein L7/L12